MVVYDTGTHITAPRQGDAQGIRRREEIQSWIDHCSIAQTTVTLENRAHLRDFMLDETVTAIDGNTKRTTRIGCAAVHAAITAHGPFGPG
jgi:hypothetical protein